MAEFLLAKKAEGKAERTLHDYRYYLQNFFTRHPDAWPDYHRLRTAVREHFASLADKSPTVHNLNRQNLKAFFRWCVLEGYLVANPVDGIPKRKNEGRPRSVDAEAIKALLSLLDRNSYVGLRDIALICLQLDTGIRPGEALQLLPSHVNLKTLEVHIPAAIAKTRQPRTVVISPQTARAIKKLLLARPEEWGDQVPLFASQDRKTMTMRSWTQWLQKYSRKIGVRITAYSLRHTAAIMALRNGGSAFFVQRQLGHTSLSTTRRYVHLAEADLHREHAVCSPVASLYPENTRARRKLKGE